MALMTRRCPTLATNSIAWRQSKQAAADTVCPSGNDAAAMLARERWSPTATLSLAGRSVALKAMLFSIEACETI